MKDVNQLSKETKANTLYATLREMALSLGAHQRLPSVRDLCQSLDTSRTTLDPVLNDLEAHDVIYRKHGSGLYISPKLFRKTIAIIINANWLTDRARLSPIWGLFWGLLAQEAQQRTLSKNEYYCLQAVIPTPDAPLSEEIVGLVRTGRMQCVLNIGVPYEAVQWLTAHNVPCISFFIHSPWMIRLDTTEMVRLAVEHLAQQGCKRIGLWAIHTPTATRELSNSLKPEIDTFRAVLAEHALAYDPALVKSAYLPKDTVTDPPTLTNQRQGYLIAQDVFGHAEQAKPDGLVILDDMLTEGALIALLGQGIQLGKDLQIVTHANAGTMAFLEYVQGIRVLEFDPQHVIQAMFSIADALLVGKQVPEQNIAILPRWRPSSHV